MAEGMGPAAFMWPPDRTWSSMTDNIAPCGSVGDVRNRTQFPLTGGRVALVAQDESFSVKLSISWSNDPLSNSNFETLITSEQMKELDEGHTCVPVAEPPNGTTAGSNATLQIVYTADFDKPENQTFYACADITYVQAGDFATTIPCFNATEDTGATFNHTVPTLTAKASEFALMRPGLSGGAIAGTVVGVVAGLGLLVSVALLLYRERKQKYRLLRQRDSVRQVKDTDAVGKHSVSQITFNYRT